MRRLIESLTPRDRPIAWTLIGAMFAVYVAVMAAAANVYVAHQTRANLAQKTGATVATGTASAATSEPGVLRSLGHLARYD